MKFLKTISLIEWLVLNEFILSSFKIMLKSPQLIIDNRKTTGTMPTGFDSGNRKKSVEQLSKASTFGEMLENVRSLASSKDLWDDEMQRDIPKKWEKHGDMIVFPQHSFTHSNWRYIGRELWRVVAESLKVARLGRKRFIGDDDDRTPHVDLLYGEDGWVEHVDNRGIRFVYDASKRVFNNKKMDEMQRISQWNCHGETVVDMYAGLGYYTMRFLKCCDAKRVICIDWSDDMCEALRRTAEANGVQDQMEILEGDCRRVTPSAIADRVYLGLVPSCRAHWLTACKALKKEGGMLHIHERIDGNTMRTVQRDSTGKGIPTRVQSLDEDPVSKENKPAKDRFLSDVAAMNNYDNNIEPTKRKFTRSQTVVEELESRKFPQPKVIEDFEKNGWKSLPAVHKEFAINCATNCTQFLNNMHFSDTMYCTTIVNLTRYSNHLSKSDHIVLDMLCAPEDVPIEKLVTKYLTLNHT
ncbi:Met-10+ like-protein [Dictyocaulus viviparus]|uniref:tRNA(Phe) (4-demethylwyosine(37)-C(7)) aminocarboxypropyltransferase n=1 Tax=Dictyocaulus viviparus TaxID=29172 RepID=A0A0D8Y3K5_DICVI|nr:Met-10+ like-protein [Dictyocaulus viviparus]